jgi:hypothetical protein
MIVGEAQDNQTTVDANFRDESEDDSNALMRRKLAKKLKEKQDKKEKKERETSEREHKKKKNRQHVLPSEDEDEDEYSEAGSLTLTSTALQHHSTASATLSPYSAFGATSGMMNNVPDLHHSNPVVARFLREQKIAQQAHQSSGHKLSDSNHSNSYLSPQKNALFVTGSCSLLGYEDLPQPEFSPLQLQQQAQEQEHQHFDFRGNFVRQIADLTNSHLKAGGNPPVHDGVHDGDEPNENEPVLAYEDRTVAYGSGAGSSAAAGEDGDIMVGRSSRPRQYSITSTGSW